MPNGKTVYDGFLELSGGVNSGWSAALIPNNTLSFAWNCTVRGGLISHRPVRNRIPLQFTSNILKNRVIGGKFQGASFYQPDSGIAYLVASISGRLFKFPLMSENSLVEEITIRNQTLTTALFVAPATSTSFLIFVQDTTNIKPGVSLQIGDYNFSVDGVASGTSLSISNVDAPIGTSFPAGTPVTFWDVNPALRPQSWFLQAEKWLIIQDGQSVPIIYNGAVSRRSRLTLGEISCGKMMEYHKGRIIKVNPDGRTFVIGDIVYGDSGTAIQQHRDAVLYFNENTYLAGGGYWTIPGEYGLITFMRGMATLDTALGQGPVMVGTKTAVFSINLPTHRDDWADQNDPLLTVAQINNGGQGQNSAINVNGDLFYRSQDGIRSLVQGVREFTTSWGNTPISREMNRVLPYDDERLLRYASSTVFDNRMLITVSPVFSQRGAFHRGLVSLDLDVLTSMRNKAPSVYDGLWLGMNTLQILSGDVDNEERCFEFVITGPGDLELWELSKGGVRENDLVYPRWIFETCDFFRKGPNFNELDLKELEGGFLYVEDVIGRVDFRVWYRPDRYPCWIYWHHWAVCNDEEECDTDENGCVVNTIYKPGYKHRMGFGKPPPQCSAVENDRPTTQGYSFQLKVQIDGHCKVRGMKLMSRLVSEPKWGRIECEIANDANV